LEANVKRSFSFIVLVLMLSSVSVFAGPVKIKFATLAPEGTTWMNVMDEFNKELKQKTENRVQFKIYPGGVHGDEHVVIRKMRIGQLAAGGFTGNGLGAVLPEMRVLELPLLFNNNDEFDYVIEKMNPTFQKLFRKKGYELIGWADVGFVKIYSKGKPVTGIDSMKGLKMWSWSGDKLAESVYKTFGITPNQIALPEVLLALQTGMVEGVYSSPMGMIALQWFNKVNYMSDFKFTYATGAILITKRQFKKIKPNDQKTLMELGKKYCRKLIDLTRKDNDKAEGLMNKRGIKRIQVPAGELNKIRNLSTKVYSDLAGKLYTKKILQDVQKHLKDYRTKK
jgi:TRAP-type C4-dicarboxylate transport system substrate-binding protein